MAEYLKPEHVFDREREWASLASFASSPGSTSRLGIVSGRRRQGKTYLLDALTNAVGGFYFVATDDTESEALRRFGEALADHSGGGRYQFRNWDEAIERLYSVVQTGLIVIDEFPYLMKASPVLPSLLQKAIDPAGVARKSHAKLLLCGSAMSVMGHLLDGNAPLRGRASLELIVKPMDYRTVADFWGVSKDPRLAVSLHAIVGGTPAYRHEFVNSEAPTSMSDFDTWVVRTVLNPAVPLFREARYLLAEETEIREAATYHAVLAAIASGNTSRGAIASYLSRPSTNIGQPLLVLEDAGLIAREVDAFKKGKVYYRITEPLISFYEEVMRRHWSLLERGQAEAAWQHARAEFSSQILGPHYESLCREFAMTYGSSIFGALPGEVGAGTVPDQQNRTKIEIDVAVLSPGSAGKPRAVVSLGEAKWGKTMGIRHLERLKRARALLVTQGFDAENAYLTCYSGAGFDDELRAAAKTDPKIQLVGLERLYGLG